MTKKAHAMKRGIALLVGCLVGIPAVSQAAPERKSPLADAPAIRKRLELRSMRGELGVGTMQTLNQDFYNALLVDVKAGFHFTDWLAFTGSFGFNMTPNWRTSFNSKLNSTLSTSCRDPKNVDRTGDEDICDGQGGRATIAGDKTPTQANAAAAQNRIQWIGLAQFEIAPITGKFSLFSKIFMNYDFYVIVGGAVVNLMKKGNVDNSYCDGGNVCRVDYSRPITGMKYGVNAGVGMHAFANNFFALNLELRDLMYKNNASGRAITSRTDVYSSDQVWTHNWLVGLNFMFFLPADVKSSR
jgi:outer membrane beta-barrel protein